MARKVSGLSRNGPQAPVVQNPISTNPQLNANSDLNFGLQKKSLTSWFYDEGKQTSDCKLKAKKLVETLTFQ